MTPGASFQKIADRNSEPPPQPRQQTNSNNWIALSIAIHFAIDFLIARTVLIPGTYLFIVILMIPISQVSLVAIWATTSHRSLTVRSLVSLGTMIGLWFLFAYHLDSSISQLTANWAIVLIIQFATIFSAINIRQRVIEGQQGNPSPFSFDLSALMTATAIAAVLFGCFQFGRNKWHWELNLTDSSNIMWIVLGGIGGFIGASACWTSTAGSRQHFIKRLIAASAIVAISVLTLCGVSAILSSGTSLNAVITSVVQTGSIIAAMQASHFVIVLATLLLVQNRNFLIASAGHQI